MKRIVALLGVVLVVTSISIGAIACSDDDEGSSDNTPQATSQATEPSGGETPSGTSSGGGTAVSVNLTEYLVAPDITSVPAGPVTFTAKNIGGTEHELVVIKTDLAPEALPTKDDGSMNEDGDGVQVIDEVEGVAAGTESELTVDLEAGNYVLVCNIVQENSDGTTTSHYERGMHTAFTVE